MRCAPEQEPASVTSSSSRAIERGGYHEGRYQSALWDVQRAQSKRQAAFALGAFRSRQRASQGGVQRTPSHFNVGQE